MPTVTLKRAFRCDIADLWRLVTDLSCQSWRRGLAGVEVLSPGEFTERTSGGFVTRFTVTAREEHRRWEFDLENENICGHWSGVFTVRGPVCEFESTETIRVKRALMRPFARAYLRSQQRRYMADLQRALSRR